ncbi:cupin domain-containing protein [Pendulispora albinea]|uniref:Cupin domain-containing protein n=1 Tax=Pendulispora albinea TaxID=2741071 RepID=A0ABZ2LZA6_9BACT
MIVTHIDSTSRSADDDSTWRCLARRGMLHSECEAIDYLRLPPGVTRDGRGREGVEAAWFVLSGCGRFTDGEERSVPLQPGDLLFWSGGTSGSVHSDSTTALELLSLTMLPTEVTGRLPARIPEAAWVLDGSDRMVVTTLDEPSDVYEMHGGERVARWKCLVRRNNMFGPWEAVERSCLPPGAASGTHLHSRTEQFDYVVSGSGVMTINGTDNPVAAGDLITTCLGTQHGIRNTGSDDLVWLVIEVSGPGMAPGSPDRGTNGVRAAIINLREAREVDALDYLAGPLNRARLVRLDPLRTESLVARDEEHVLFTLSGSGTARAGATAVPLRHGVSVGVPFLGDVVIEGGPDGLEFFVVSLAIPAAVGGAK